MNTILLAADGSPSNRQAIAAAIELAGALDGTLHVVSAWRTPVYDYGYVPLQYAHELTEAQRELAEKALTQAVEQAAAAGIVATSELREGEPASKICAAAEKLGADMIVVGAHGWGAVRRFLFGSVSTAVLHHATCPVLVVRGTGVTDEKHAEAAARSRA